MTDLSLRKAISHNSSTPQTCDTRVVWAAAACAAFNRRGCNIVCALRMLSDFYIAWVCLGRKTQNVGNIRTVEVLTFNPSGPYISV